jgi:hypothetical protein
MLTVGQLIQLLQSFEPELPVLDSHGNKLVDVHTRKYKLQNGRFHDAALILELIPTGQTTNY